MPPTKPADPVPVVVTDYGRHSTLLLPDADHKQIEFAFGDYGWLAARHTGAWEGVEAMFFSDASAFGLRWLDAPADAPQLPRLIGCDRVMRFDVDRARAEALRQELIRRFEREAVTTTFNSDDKFCYVRDAESYALWHNCNHETAAWLKELGCKVEGDATTSKFKLADAEGGVRQNETK